MRTPRAYQQWAAATVALLLVLAAGGSSRAQEVQSLFLWVVDGAGFPVLDMRPEEVEIIEDDDTRFTVALEQVRWPMKLHIIVDNSSHMVPALGQLRAGLRELVTMLPDGVEIEIVATSPQPRFVVRMTADRQEALEGIGRIVPDTGIYTAFVDALVEASDRIRDDDSPHFATVLVIAGNGTDPSVTGGYERKIGRLIEQTNAKPATYHVAVWMDPAQRAPGGQGTVAGAVQTLVGTEITNMTGGFYETLAASSRLATLLPELGERIAVSHARQSTQYRVTYQRPPDAVPPQGIRANLFRLNVEGFLSFDGRMP